MSTFKIEALEDDVDIAALVWREVTARVKDHQGSFIGSASDFVPKTEKLNLDTGDEMDNISHLGRVNRIANPAMPQIIGQPVIIADVLRVTKISEDKPNHEG
jgi:hypothetical protein